MLYISPFFIRHNNNISIYVEKSVDSVVLANNIYFYKCIQNQQIMVVQDINDSLFILGPNESLNDINLSIKKCIIIQMKSVASGRIKAIHVNESLPGQQTPEKAKQASFVSLDVRKKVLVDLTNLTIIHSYQS